MSYELILKNISRYIQLDSKEEKYFISLLEIRKVRKKQFILVEGDICRYANFVNKGCFRLFNMNEDGFERIVQFAIEDWWISDMYSFITQEPAIFNIDAQEDSEVVRMSKKNLDELFQKVPKFERFFRILAENTFIVSQQRFLKGTGTNAKEKYMYFMERYPQLVDRLPQNQIAAFIGISPEFLSKIKKKIAEFS